MMNDAPHRKHTLDKGRNLYNHDPACQAAGQGNPLFVAKGYMDVIALVEAGFSASVAPVGMAITEHQLQILWSISSEPIIALNRDTSGLRAAMRTIDLALPLLEAGKSLRFAQMPKGMDLDDLLRTDGQAAVHAVLESHIPIIKLLWQGQTKGKVFDCLESKAALDKSLHEKVKLIRDPSIRSHYQQDFKDLCWQLFRPQRQSSKRSWQPGGKSQTRPQPTTLDARSSFLASADNVDIRVSEGIILAIAILNPHVVAQFEPHLLEMECHDADHAALLGAILCHADDDPDTLQDHIVQTIGPTLLENLLALRHIAVNPCVSKPGDVENAKMTLTEEFAKIKTQRGVDAEIAEASDKFSDLNDETLTSRLAQAVEERNRTSRCQSEDKAIFGVVDNDARINRDEKEAFNVMMSDINSATKRR